jgi:alpha-glucuronidase
VACAVTSWFLQASGIPDKQGHSGHHTYRTEVESMTLDGYAVKDVKPWEPASGGKAVACSAPQCEAQMRFNGEPGWYELRVRYFDQNNGAPRFELSVNGQKIDSGTADDHLPTQKLDGSSSTRRMIPGVPLRPGDIIRIKAAPNGGELAALDYLEIRPERN